MTHRVALPTVAEYCAAILGAEGAYFVCGNFHADLSDAALARKRVAERWCADDERRAARIRRMVQDEQVA